MNLYEKIKNTDLPIKQQRVIEKILGDLESAAFLSGHEICEKYNISFSSLSRMAKTLNYNGFPEFKKEVELLYKSEFSPTTRAETFLEGIKGKSIAESVINAELIAINYFQKNLSDKDIASSMRKVNSAKRVFVIGIGQLEPIVDKFQNSLKLLRKKVVVFKNIGFSKAIEPYSVSQSDVVICFSINKELVEFKELLDVLNTKKISSILITDKKAGRLRKISEQSFVVSSSGNGMINSLTSYFIMTNILEAYLFSLDKHVCLDRIKNIENTWNKLPLFLN
ncbi:MAG: hypothetical protein A2381_18465 [Bdellovibrionales bacterium RIFOXYB1_FULL_37_110]|nr:MAG: hypothetical protein A2417_01305 [Bdellovibrionales bacterium RIFOXYC1_FULL_37_79]OFZ59015.1 MAG: hypothetical protein A2381_18465 [Bdellovibrionales bacterium RIFOXYB1_FULL_37_110]OFZ65120.1 MAG: hypothetical protein A2577_04780 [Bdellovibrionales bacterium RIFOXYD1_FULL_36_51]